MHRDTVAIFTDADKTLENWLSTTPSGGIKGGTQIWQLIEEGNVLGSKTPKSCIDLLTE